jgi:hypothetical protein
MQIPPPRRTAELQGKIAANAEYQRNGGERSSAILRARHQAGQCADVLAVFRQISPHGTVALGASGRATTATGTSPVRRVVSHRLLEGTKA